MSTSSVSRIATGTKSMIIRMEQASKRHRRPILYTVLGLAAAVGLKIGYDHYQEYQRIHSQVNPAQSCYLYHPETIFSDIVFEDRRQAALSPYEIEDLKNIFASIDYRFTSGLRRVVLTGKGVNEDGQAVSGRYERDTQTIYIYESRGGNGYLGLARTCQHEVGHHVQQKLQELDSEIPLWKGADEELFAQAFSLVALSWHPDIDWEKCNSHGIDASPTPEQLESMRAHLFCAGPDFNSDNGHALSIRAKTYLDFAHFDRFIETFERLQDLPFNPMAPTDIRNYWALRKGRFEYVHPFSLFNDLLKAKSNSHEPYLDRLGIPEENLRRAPDILRTIPRLAEEAYRFERHILKLEESE